MNDLLIIKQFLEEHFEEFQRFLEDRLEIEGTEAEGIVDRLEANDAPA